MFMEVVNLFFTVIQIDAKWNWLVASINLWKIHVQCIELTLYQLRYSFTCFCLFVIYFLYCIYSLLYINRVHTKLKVCFLCFHLYLKSTNQAFAVAFNSRLLSRGSRHKCKNRVLQIVFCTRTYNYTPI